MKFKLELSNVKALDVAIESFTIDFEMAAEEMIETIRAQPEVIKTLITAIETLKKSQQTGPYGTVKPEDFTA